jgi:hypothetical protein
MCDMLYETYISGEVPNKAQVLVLQETSEQCDHMPLNTDPMTTTENWDDVATPAFITISDHEMERMRQWKDQNRIIYCECCGDHGQQTIAVYHMAIWAKCANKYMNYYMCHDCHMATENTECLCMFKCNKHPCGCDRRDGVTVVSGTGADGIEIHE